MPESEISQHNIIKTPWHLWVVGILSILFNSMGVMDFAMTKTKNEAYMSSFTEEELEFFSSFPMWVSILWGVAVIGATLGSLLLLLRQKLACKVFVVSLIAMVITSVHNKGVSNALEVIGEVAPIIISIMIFVIILLLAIYSRSMMKKGILV